MEVDSKKVDAGEPANTSAIAPTNHSHYCAIPLPELREIKYEKGYVRTRSRDFTMLFERASLKEKVDGELVLQSLVAKLEQRFGLSIISPELKSLVPNIPVNIDHCSVFGPRTHISRLIQNEVEALYATNEEAGMARAVLLQLWDKRVVAAVSDSLRRKISLEALNLIAQARDNEDDSNLRNKYDELKEENYHEAVTYLLHSNKMLSASTEAIELLLEHKFYWDAAVLARRYLTPSNETFKNTFTKWAEEFVSKEKSSSGDKNKTFKIDAAKCYIVMDMYAKAASQLVKSNDLKSLLLACRLSQIDVKAAELKGDSNAIETAKKNASEIGNAAVRRCVIMCQWDVAAGLIQLMQLSQDWSHVVSMHQALLLRLRPLLGQTRLHQKEQFILRIPADAYPVWAVNIVTNGAFVKGIWEYWKATFSVGNYDKSAANALALQDIESILHDSQRHLILFDVACQMVAGLMQGASEQKDVAHKTFTTLFENCRYFDQIEAEIEKIFKEMVAETSDDESLGPIINVLVAVVTERENAANMAAMEADVAKQKETANETAVDHGHANIVAETDMAAYDASAVSIVVDVVKEIDVPTNADGANEINSANEEDTPKEFNVIEKIDHSADVIDVLKDAEVAKDRIDLLVAKDSAMDREEPRSGSLSDRQQLDQQLDKACTEPMMTSNDPDSCSSGLPAISEEPTVISRTPEEIKKIVSDIVNKGKKFKSKTVSPTKTPDQDKEAP